ncbi:MAG: L-threonylcarbamoyladenylate synthase [Chloroflexi bacterium]|nr:L-threonylcarbamoyladenylate synthase [Chloroflexota bacterium]
MEKSSLQAKITPALLGQVKKTTDIMRSGGIVAYPTDTVYGLGADIFNNAAVTRIFAVKKRPLTMPLPVLIAETSQLGELVEFIPAAATVLMDRFWPGGLTIVFAKAPAFDSLVLAGSGKIAVRLPGHSITLRLIQELGRPMVGTSANLHNCPAALTAKEVRDQLGDTVDFILDGGSCPGGIESTVVDITMNPPVILRKGAVPAKDLMDLLD